MKHLHRLLIVVLLFCCPFFVKAMDSYYFLDFQSKNLYEQVCYTFLPPQILRYFLVLDNFAKELPKYQRDPTYTPRVYEGKGVVVTGAPEFISEPSESSSFQTAEAVPAGAVLKDDLPTPGVEEADDDPPLLAKQSPPIKEWVDPGVEKVDSTSQEEEQEQEQEKGSSGGFKNDSSKTDTDFSNSNEVAMNIMFGGGRPEDDEREAEYGDKLRGDSNFITRGEEIEPLSTPRGEAIDYLDDGKQQIVDGSKTLAEQLISLDDRSQTPFERRSILAWFYAPGSLLAVHRRSFNHSNHNDFNSRLTFVEYLRNGLDKDTPQPDVLKEDVSRTREILRSASLQKSQADLRSLTQQVVVNRASDSSSVVRMDKIVPEATSIRVSEVRPTRPTVEPTITREVESMPVVETRTIEAPITRETTSVREETGVSREPTVDRGTPRDSVRR